MKVAQVAVATLLALTAAMNAGAQSFDNNDRSNSRGQSNGNRADDDNRGRSNDNRGRSNGNRADDDNRGRSNDNRGNDDNNGRSDKVRSAPEIDVTSGGLAIVLLVGGVLLVAERLRRRGQGT